MSLNQFIASTAARAEEARRAGGSSAQLADHGRPIRRGIVTATDAGTGTYTVALRKADGSAADSIAGLLPWGDATLDVGDEVWVVWEMSPIPFILAAAGGSSGSGTDTLIVGYIRFFS